MKSSDWIIARVSSSNRGNGVFRYPKAKPVGWKELPLSEEVSLSWNYEGEFPEPSTKLEMDQMEEALEELVSGEGSSLVMTVGGLREWVFYTRDYESFIVTLNRCLTGMPRFPIAIEHSSDPDWKYWHSFVDWLEKQEPNNSVEATATSPPVESESSPPPPHL
jgi:hypothetical protein